MRILLIEDDPMIGKGLREALQDAGMSVDWTRNGEDGEAAMSVGAYALVLLDIGLPGLNGYDVAKQLRQMNHQRPQCLIAMTGYGSDEDRQRTEEAGFNHHIVKPIEPAELNKLLARSIAAMGG